MRFLQIALVGVVLACAAVAGRAADMAVPGQSVDWPNPGYDKAGTRYAPLDQINRQNVGRLKVAWTYYTGDAGPGNSTTIECTPLVVDGVMYITTATTKVVALDAATGREQWKFDPYSDRYKPPGGKWIKASGGVNRGVAYSAPGGRKSQNPPKRILLGTSDGRLISLDALTGKPDPDFGKAGVVDLRAGIERDISKMPYGPTSPPMVFQDSVIVGCSNGEGHPAAPGDVRAFNVHTGKELWRFHTLPRPGELAGDTWEPGAVDNRGGANPWGGFTLDWQSGILFCATGSAGADFYGADRKGDNLFANCVLALDARTGERMWHFQTVRHDLWDHDNPCPPVVVTVKHDGKDVRAVAQVTKTGYCYLLDMATGRPLFGVRDEPTPPSDVPGEVASPSQPVPLKPPPLSRTRFTEADATDISPEANRFVLEKLKSLRHGQPHLPPSERGTVVTPGFHGGATWSGASFDPTTGLLYVNTNDAPYIAGLKKRNDGGYEHAGYGYFNDQEGYPAIKPPWGSLTAIDLNRGEFAWRVTLGEFPELTKRGIPPTGTENFGGTIVTAGGLVFIGATKDERLRAFDKSTGKVLWEHQLDAGGYATPCTYAVGGRQFVCIAAGGGGKPRTKSGDAFVAFALDDVPLTQPATQATAAPATPAGRPATRPYDPVDAYDGQAIDGWKVLVHKALPRDEPALHAEVMDVLRQQLFLVRRTVPAEALAKLRTVPLWIELDNPRFPGACYHPSASWLRANNVNPEKAGAIEVANARNFVGWTNDQPYMVLHEMAHAYHDRHLPGGFDNPEILAAYRAAKKAGLYERVRHIGGRLERSYAMTNQQEYFAESTEALFGTNDFFPFVRAELKEYDPAGYEAVRKAWGKGR